MATTQVERGLATRLMQAIGCFGKLVCLTASSRNQALSELSKLEQPTASPAHGRSRRSLAEAQDLAAAICHASAAERFSHTRVQAFVMQVVAQARFRERERDTTTQQPDPETGVNFERHLFIATLIAMPVC